MIGVGTDHSPPEMVLLDEVHTYSGTHGAQVAHLLRRWRHAVGDRGAPQFTGLSATLRSARSFFATLTGLSPSDVQKVAPRSDDLTESKSAEYQLALRGDPVSGTSLLSTSIQALMLLRRILDPRDNDVSGGLYGQRAFAFTDNLDVINRLFHNFLDAEGRHSGGWIQNQSYARFRSPLYEDGLDEAERFRWGQSWRLVEEIGHDAAMSHPLHVDRTSSQDAGVRQNSDVVIATASLEVGYNDSSVGAILQHKAPMSMASFLQRKGRAGRPPKMRPWTVVVLSDYGRDRIAYQSYETLFRPVIEKRSLPVSNRYVLRMQAVFATMDWLSHQMRSTSLRGGTLWKDLGAPAEDSYTKQEARKRYKRQKWLASTIRSILEGEAAVPDLQRYVQAALDLTDAETHAVFWEPPRALMTSVLPTALRRLESQWSTHAAPERTHEPYNQNPLPEFIPAALFSDLHLPDVEIRVPQTEGDPETHTMPIAQALREYAPGRASRRFGIHSDEDTHWIRPPSLDSDDQTQYLSLPDICRGENLGPVQTKRPDGRTMTLPCIRPWRLHAEQLPENVRESAHAALDWRTQILPFQTPNTETVSDATYWNDLLPSIAFYRHETHNPVVVRRFAIASETEIGIDPQDECNARIEFTDENGRPAALGFQQEVDAIAFRVALPEDFDINPNGEETALLRALRSSFLEERLQTTSALDGLANQFQRDWLYQLSTSALVRHAEQTTLTLREAFEDLCSREETWGNILVNVLDHVFQALPADAEGTTTGREPTRDDLQRLCRHPVVTQTLQHELPVLWDPPLEAWRSWTRRRFLSSLGRALVQACHLLCPEFEEGELLFDLDAGPRPDAAQSPPTNLDELWITEQTMGGTGVVEEVARHYRADPRRFFQLLESVLTASDREVVDRELQRILSLSQSDDVVQDALEDVRHAEGLQALDAANAHLRDCLAERGVLGVHAVYSALQTRVLRPGSTNQTDTLLHDLVQDWIVEEQRLGIEISARTFAYTASRHEAYEGLWEAIDAYAAHDASWRFQTIYGLLWARGRAIRERALETYNPFATLPPGDRLLVLAALPDRYPSTDLSSPNWNTTLRQQLRERGIAQLSCISHERAALQQAILQVIVNPLETDYLHVYPRLNGIKRTNDGFVATLVLSEVVQ